MFLFGVTGGIGSGKSAVCTYLKEKGVDVLEADPLAKQLTVSNSEIRQELIKCFGKDVYTRDGEINKERMRELVFSKPQSREQINQIIHPHVLQWIDKEAKRLNRDMGRSLIGVEAALIFESKMEKILDAVVVVHAPLKQRIHWVQTRNGLSREEVENRMNAQMSVDEQIRRADYVLNNSGSLEELRHLTNELFDWLRERV